MIWFYTREQQTLTLETRYDNDTLEYVALVISAGGPPETKRFQSVEDFRTWLVSFERNLTVAEWRVDGPPHLLADGWPNRKPRR